MQSRHTVKFPDPKLTENTGKNLVNVSELQSRPVTVSAETKDTAYPYEVLKNGSFCGCE